MKKFGKEFAAFINKGNIFELATAVVIGNALKALIDAIVQYLIMPLIGKVTPKQGFESWVIFDLKIGLIIQAGINFIIIGLVVFIIIKIMAKFKSKNEEEEVIVLDRNEILLAEIRDILKQNNQELPKNVKKEIKKTK